MNNIIFLELFNLASLGIFLKINDIWMDDQKQPAMHTADDDGLAKKKREPYNLIENL